LICFITKARIFLTKLPTSAKLLLLKIRRLEKFREVSKCVQLVAMSALHGFKESIESRFESFSIINYFFKWTLFSSVKKKNTAVSIDATYTTFLIAFVSSDRSCSGSINSQLYDSIYFLANFIKDQGKDFKLISLGKKGHLSLIKKYSSEITASFFFLEKEAISFSTGYLISMLLKKVYFDKLYIIFNQYIDTFDHRVVAYEVPSFGVFASHVYKKTSTSFVFELLLSKQKFNSKFIVCFYDFAIALLICNALDENYLCSIGSRIMAMDAAIKNATSVLSILQLAYNKARQSAITNEIIEILNAATVIGSK